MIKIFLFYVLKTIEMFQYALLSLICSLIISELLEMFLYKFIINKERSIYKKIIFSIISIYFLVIGLYLITKYINKIPFLLNPLSKLIGYKTSLNNERMLGIVTGLNWIYFSRQNSFVKVLDELISDMNIYLNI